MYGPDHPAFNPFNANTSAPITPPSSPSDRPNPAPPAPYASCGAGSATNQPQKPLEQKETSAVVQYALSSLHVFVTGLFRPRDFKKSCKMSAVLKYTFTSPSFSPQYLSAQLTHLGGAEFVVDEQGGSRVRGGYERHEGTQRQVAGEGPELKVVHSIPPHTRIRAPLSLRA